MSNDEIIKRLGNEYPAAITSNGERLPLKRESRYWRIYESPSGTGTHFFSRFMDGSASITAAELQAQWQNWSEHQRSDFCQAGCWLHEQADFPEILRFITQHGSPSDWSGIALSIASYFPLNEAFDTLL